MAGIFDRARPLDRPPTARGMAPVMEAYDRVQAATALTDDEISDLAVTDVPDDFPKGNRAAEDALMDLGNRAYEFLSIINE